MQFVVLMVMCRSVCLCTCVPVCLCMGHLQVVAKRKPSPTHTHTHTIHSSVRIVQFNKLFRSSIWCPLSKIKTNSIQPTQTVTSAHGPDVSQFNFCARRRKIVWLLTGSCEQYGLWWAGTAVAFGC